MKRVLIGGATLAVVAWGVAVAVVAERAPGRADQATSAAVNAIWGDDPPAGIGASCRYEPDLGMVLLRARYRCAFSDCFEVTDRLDVTDHARGDWTYSVTEGGLPSDPGAGRTGPARSAGSTLDREGCDDEASGLLQHRLEVLVGHVLAGRPAGGELRRALPGWSVGEIARARLEVAEAEVEARTARVRVSVGREVRVLEARLTGRVWRIR